MATERRSESDSDASTSACESDISLSDSDIDNMLGKTRLPSEGPEAYAFEPRVPRTKQNKKQVAAAPDPEPDPRAHRLNNTDWCLCGKCTILPTSRECKCCHEENDVANKILKGTQCVTENQAFQNICMDFDALEVALLLIAHVRVDSLKRPLNSV